MTSLNIDNVNNTSVTNNTTFNTINNTIVYDRKMGMGRITPEHVLWTVVAIGGLFVIVLCVVIGLCVSCWCSLR
jgi:hypothetical protein